MADELKQDLALEAELIEGSKGIFDIRVDGTLVFSKYETKRFPDPGEVSRLLRSAQQSQQ